MVPIAIGVGIMAAIMLAIELNNVLNFAYIRQLDAFDIAIVGSLVGIALAAWFGVIRSKDDEEK